MDVAPGGADVDVDTTSDVLDEVAMFDRAVRKHDVRLHKAASRERREQRQGQAQHRQHHPLAPSQRGGGTGAYGLRVPRDDHNDDPDDDILNGDATIRGRRDGVRSARRVTKASDVIRAECARRAARAEHIRQREREGRRRVEEQHAARREAGGEDARWSALPVGGVGAENREDTEGGPSRGVGTVCTTRERGGEPLPPAPASPAHAAEREKARASLANATIHGRGQSRSAHGAIPGKTRGGLRGRYEQVKVFRDGNSLFHCARLAEIVCQARESGGGGGVSAHVHGDSIAAVLRRGIRSIGQAQAACTALHLREGAAGRIATVDEDEEAAAEHGGALADDVPPRDVDTAIAAALTGAGMLTAHEMPSGAPLDNWRRAMAGVARTAASHASPATGEGGSEAIESDVALFARASAVREAYRDAVSQSHVPGSFLEVAALAAHMRRPITIIRGPVGGGDDAGLEPTSGERRWRATCATEVVGAAHGARGRGGFTLFWELGEGVPPGLPAGDFILLVPRRPDDAPPRPSRRRQRTRGGARVANDGASVLPRGGDDGTGSPARRGAATSSPGGGILHSPGGGAGLSRAVPRQEADAVTPPPHSNAASERRRQRRERVERVELVHSREEDEQQLQMPARDSSGGLSVDAYLRHSRERRAARERERSQRTAAAPAAARVARTGFTPVAAMLAAAGDGQKVAVARHARRGVSLAEVDEKGNTALHRAATSGSIGLVKVVLKYADQPGQPSRGAMLEAVNADGRTPLAVAVSLQHVKLAKFLRSEGAADRAGLVQTLADMSGYDTSGGYSSSSVGTLGDTNTDGGSPSGTSDSESEGSALEQEHGAGFPRQRGMWEGHNSPVLFSSIPRQHKYQGGYSYYRDSRATTEGGRPDSARSSRSGCTEGVHGSGSGWEMPSSVSSSGYSGYDTETSSRGGWSDMTPAGSQTGSEGGDSLWNSEAESSYQGSQVGDSASEWSDTGESEDQVGIGGSVAGVHGDCYATYQGRMASSLGLR